MKKKTIFITAFVTVIAIGGIAAFFLLHNNPAKVNYSDMPANLIAAAVGHIGIDENFDTDDYSLVYNNADGTKTMYVYTHPIRYFGSDGQYHIIDNAILESDNGYENKSNDINTIFTPDKLSVSLGDYKISLALPAIEQAPKLMDIKTILGNKQEAVQYAHDNYTISCYPTYLGAKIQFDLDKPISEPLSFDLNPNGLSVDTSNSFYIDFLNESYITSALLYQPIVKDSDGKILRLPDGFQYSDGKLNLDLSVLKDVKYPISIEFTLNMYKKKQADSGMLSAYPNDNQYLDNYLYAGNFEDMGEAESLLRFESSLYKTIQSGNVISAEYLFNSLITLEDDALQVHECDKDWASTKVTWNTRDKYDAVIGEVKRDGNDFSCDLTELLKKWIDDSVDSHKGFQIIGSETEGGVIFPSADNGYCSPMLVVNFKGE